MKKRWQRIRRKTVWMLCAALMMGFLMPVVATAQPTGETDVIRKNTYMDVDETLPEDQYPAASLFSLEPETTTQSEVPAAYRSDQVSQNGTQVSYLPSSFKEQGSFGACWTFSALGACEASMIRNGYADHTMDLSERHLAYYFYNKGETGDPKGGTTGDYNVVYPSTEEYLDIGGNSAYTMWHLASWCGPVAETAAPYDELLSFSTDKDGLLGQPNSTQMAYEMDACHVQNVYKIALGNMTDNFAQKQLIKQLIMEYGALAMSYYSIDMYDCPQYDSYYNTTYTGTNHAIQVVGWDDDFPKEHFNTEAPGDGAWLMKNSWGDEYSMKAQCGYFWLSYYDMSINSSVQSNGTIKMPYVYVYDAQPADNYDNIYQYDGDSMSGTVTFTETEPLAMRFVAGESDGKQEKLRAVGIGVGQSYVSGKFEIYTNLENTSGDPTQGTLSHTQNFSLEYPGYHTIDLEKEIYLTDGSQFTVVYYFDQETSVNVSYDKIGSFVQFITNENEDVCYWRGTSGNWNDLTSSGSGYVARIKAYTDNTDLDSPLLRSYTLNHTTATLHPGETLALAAKAEYVGALEDIWQKSWISTEPGVAEVSQQGLVTAVSPGTTLVSVYHGEISATCVIIVEPSPVTGGTGTGTDDSGTQPQQPGGTDTGADGTGGESPTEEPEVTKPGKVTLSSVSLTSSGKAKLKWKKVSGAKGYEIYRATSKDGKFKRIKTISKASSVTAMLAANTGSKPYYYKVRAYKMTASGKKVYGSFSSVKTCGPNKPSGVKAKAYSGKKIKVTWKKTSNASGYEIYRATSKNGKYKKVKTITKAKTVSYVNKSLKKGKKYYYKVRAYRKIKGKKVYGSYSSIVSAKAK